MINQATKVRNGKISFNLPRKLQKTWKEAEVFIFQNEDTVILKRIQKPLAKLSDLVSKISSSRMSQKEINEEIQAYRKNK